MTDKQEAVLTEHWDQRHISKPEDPWMILSKDELRDIVESVLTAKENDVSESVPLYRIKDLDTDEYIQIVQTDEESD